MNDGQSIDKVFTLFNSDTGGLLFFYCCCEPLYIRYSSIACGELCDWAYTGYRI